MAIRVRLTTNAKEVKRALKRIRRHRVFNAERKMMDAGANLAKQAFVKEWNRTFDVRKRSFPRSVLRIHKAHINFNTGRINRPARLFNFAANRVLLLQIRGGVRKPKGRWLLVPQKKGQRKPRRTYIRGKAVVAYLKTKDDRLYGILAKQARIPRRFSIRAVERRVERVLPRVAERILRAELRRPVT